jgi:hypothetical protein
VVRGVTLPSPENLKIEILEEDEARKKNAPRKLTSNELGFFSHRGSYFDGGGLSIYRSEITY